MEIREMTTADIKAVLPLYISHYNEQEGGCWTETSAEMQEMIAPAIHLLDKYDHPYDVVYTNFVGTIAYEDEWQIAVQVENGEMI